MNEGKKPTLKPLLRGHLHQEAFFFSLGACTMLIAKSSQSQGDLFSLIAVVIYSLSLCGLFATSAFYHRIHWGEKTRTWMQRIDHSAIFILIAGTSTAVFQLSFPAEQAQKILINLYAVAAIGISQSLFLAKSPKWLAALLYIFAGWMVVPYISELHKALGPTQFFILLLGGIAYTIGALVYAFKFPNPSPKYFGYHEIFHILVIVAAGLHFVVIFNLIK